MNKNKQGALNRGDGQTGCEKDSIHTHCFYSPFRTDLFCCAGFAALMITLLTVSFQTIKAATANPVDSLRYE